MTAVPSSEQFTSPKVSWAKVYSTAEDLLGRRINEKQRAELWGGVANEQALSLIASILSDLDRGGSREGEKSADVKWAALVQDTRLRDKMLVQSGLGFTLFAPQVLQLAAAEAVIYCRDGPPSDNVAGLDLVVKCMFGIADETASPLADGELWGGLDASLSAEVIANLHFNRTVSIAHQLAWADRAWFQDWPFDDANSREVGGQPRDLFKEATGVEIDDFAAVAVRLYATNNDGGYVRFAPEFFEEMGVKPEAVELFLRATCQDLKTLKGEVSRQRRQGVSRFAFNSFRQFPLIRLSSGQILLFRLNYAVQRAFSEITYFDVREYLKRCDERDGTRRDRAFRACTAKVLEYEAGRTLTRMLAATKARVFDEKRLQRLHSGKNQARACDFAVRLGNTWLLIEVTDRAIPQPVVNATADVQQLDLELDRVLMERKAKQLSSTIQLLRRDPSNRGCTFVPLVLTSPAGLPWNAALHARAQQRLTAEGMLNDDQCLPVAFITMKDLRILESAASRGVDVVAALHKWRATEPGLGLDQYLHESGVSLEVPLWERQTAVAFIMGLREREKI